MVGTILKELIADLKVPQPEGCDCEMFREKLDTLTPEQCIAEREYIIPYLQDNARKVGWMAKVTAIRPAIASGLAFKINPLDPMPGLFDEAVRRAQEKSRQDRKVVESGVE